MCYFGRNNLKKKNDLDEFEDEIYVILYKRFVNDNRIDLKIKFIKIND